MRVPAEDRRQVATRINGVEYRQRDGFFEMPDAHAKAHLQSAGYGSWHVPGIAPRTVGHTCPDCGFASFFTACSRCRDRRESETADAAS